MNPLAVAGIVTVVLSIVVGITVKVQVKLKDNWGTDAK